MKKVLVANRGEIALRVMKTCREMGIKTVAVFSTPDRNALFVRFADEAVHLPGNTSAETYLQQERLLEICKELNVDGIHPGYGFLSENAEFRKKTEEAGVTFIGPSAAAMKVMGSKLDAKAAVMDYDIPMVPGTADAIDDVDEALRISKEIGFPVLIKASAGGGGKGMRRVNEESEFHEAFDRAKSEAINSFGDGAVFIEKFVTKPRHIEIQVLADTHGKCLHLFERECSIQRRHQKVVEEAPSAVLTPELRKEMGECAVRVAQACDYVGAGTVEFLYDGEGKYYFLEMNTRLQVEHPVTELITGLDLVAEQIKVARGEKLSIEQDDLRIHGHAIEIRVYAEDAENGFLPDIGTLETYQLPQGPGIRVDDAFEEGMDIPVYYDPMIAKLVVHASDRNAAIQKAKLAIRNYHIAGVKTTLNFADFVMNHDAFVSGDFDTNFVGQYYSGQMPGFTESEDMLSALMASHFLNSSSTKEALEMESSKSNWYANRI